MARTRAIPILETVRTLRRIEKKTPGKLMRARIAMLRMLQEDHKRTLRDVAAMLGVSHQSTKRWWKWYTEGGIARLRYRKARRWDDDPSFTTLRDAVIAGQFHSLDHVRGWLGGIGKTSSKASAQDDHKLSEAIYSLLTVLPPPPVADLRVWRDQLTIGLKRLFGDIDRITLTANFKCNLKEPDTYRPTAWVMGKGQASDKDISIAVEESSPIERLLEYCAKQQFPFENYHEPIGFAYSYRGAYLGAIILWRDRTRAPISPQTIGVMRRLEPFFVFIMADIVMRRHYLHPINLSYLDLLDQITQKANLTPQERRILILHSTGVSRAEIGKTFSIAVSTVRTHLNSIYAKVGVRTVNELFAQYLSKDPPKPREDR